MGWDCGGGWDVGEGMPHEGKRWGGNDDYRVSVI